ncbi:MAG: DNA cytosine methyltransferase [Candidatus Aenigmatarchaeota archaeon]
MKILDPCSSYGVALSELKDECIAKDIKNLAPFFEHNKHATFIRDDLRAPKHFFHPDIIISGIPCRPFSSLNVRTKYEAHSEFDMFQYLMRYVAIEKPYVVVVENVPQFLKYFEQFKDYIPKPYKIVHINVYNYLDFGCNWNRKRAFIILSQTSLDIDMKQYMEPSRTINEILPDTIPQVVPKVPPSKFFHVCHDSGRRFIIYCSQFLKSFGTRSVIYCDNFGILNNEQIKKILDIKLDISILNYNQQMYLLANAIHPKFMKKLIDAIKKRI